MKLWTIFGLLMVIPLLAHAQTPLPDGAERDCEDCPAVTPVADGSAMGVYPVTLGEFRVFAEETGVDGLSECFIWTGTNWRPRTDTGWSFPNFEQTDDHPAVCVSWLEATAYADWLSERTGRPYRLPTMEESVAAALAGAATGFWWGEEFDGICARANAADASFGAIYPEDERPILTCDDGYPHTSPVTAFEPNPIGLYDTVGNVWEWTNSCFKGDCSNAIFRGAAWATPFPYHFKRDGQWQDRILLRNSGIGFRVMRDAE